MTTTVLFGSDIRTGVERLMADSGSVWAAVAYWGKGGSENVGVIGRSSRPTRVLCDLYSGACHPEEILRLLAAGVEVRTSDGMHAKVWCSKKMLIVGSANASANGLGFLNDGSENEEAAVLLAETSLISRAGEWFEALWSNAASVSEDDARSVEPLWRAKQGGTGRQTVKTLLGALRSTSERKALSNVRVACYRAMRASREAHRAFRLAAAATYSAEQLGIWPGQDPFYEDDHGTWRLKPGDIILDFQVYRRTPKFFGIWQVRSKPFVASPLNRLPRNRIIVCDPLPDIAGYRIPPSQQLALGALIRERLDALSWEEDENYNLLDVSLLDLVSLAAAKRM